MILAWLKLLRPQQWTKNAFCLAGLVFSGRLADPTAIPKALLTFAVFCVASSAIYVLNDAVDAERDRLHPRKKNRPIANGSVSKTSAIVIAIILFIGSLATGLALGRIAWLFVVAY